MFNKSYIKNVGNQRYLYLYLDSSEFANEFGEREKNISIDDKVNRFLHDKNIEGIVDKVFLISNGIVVKTIDYQNKDIKIEVLDDKSNYANIKYKVKFNNENIYLKDFLIGVLFKENIYGLDDEVIKAISVLYRTYIFYKMDKEKEVINDRFINYRPIGYYKLVLYDKFQEIYEKLEKIVNETDSIFIAYNDQYILPFIHNTSNGYTDVEDDFPYLSLKYSLWDLASPNYLKIVEYNYEDLNKIFNMSKSSLQNIKVLELSRGNRVKKIQVGNKVFSGDDFKEILKLDSLDITILINDYGIRFITKGSGHGLGLSISGSMELARSGCNYLQILNYYFPKCKVKKYL